MGKDNKNWLKNNLIAIPTGIVGNCNACLFNNIKKYCAKMTCSYVFPDTITSVYWVAKNKTENIDDWQDLQNFFEKTPVLKMLDFSEEIIKDVVSQKLR